MANIGSPSLELSRTIQKQLIEDIATQGGPQSRKLYQYFDTKKDIYGAKGSQKRKQVEYFVYRFRCNNDTNLLSSPITSNTRFQDISSSPAFAKSSNIATMSDVTPLLELFSPPGYDGYYGMSKE